MVKKRRQKTFKSHYKKPTNTKIPNKEVWKSVFGYEPAYNLKVSSYGRVVLLPEIISDENGREFVLLAGRQIPVDRLVCDAFIPNRTQSEQPFHKNGILSDSTASNLAWVDYTSDPDSPGRIYSTLSMLQYILHPSLLADRDKEFSKFYAYLEYLWKTGRMPEEQEQLIMDGYDQHKKRVVEDWMQRQQLKKDVTDMLDSQYRKAMSNITHSATSKRKTKTPVTESNNTDNTDSQSHPDLPFTLPPDDVMASALTHLYERITTSAVKEPTRFHSRCWKNLAPIPFLITPAMARIVNIGDYPAELRPYDMTSGRIELKAKDSKDSYQMTGLNLASMLEQSLTAPYHLNMVPQCPRIHKEKRIKPTQHLQSLIATLVRTGEFPEWASDALIETVLNMVKYKDGSPEVPEHSKYKFGVTVKTDNQEKMYKNKFSDLQAKLTDALKEMISDADKFREETGYKDSDNNKTNRKKRAAEERRAAKAVNDSKNSGDETGYPDNTDFSDNFTSGDFGEYESESECIDDAADNSSLSGDYYDDYGFIPDPTPNKRNSNNTVVQSISDWEDGYAEPVITKITKLQQVIEETPEEAEKLFEEEYGSTDGNISQSGNTTGFSTDTEPAEEITSGLDTTVTSSKKEIKPGTEEHRLLNPNKYTPEGIYIGNNRNPESKYNRDVHPNRVNIISDDVIRIFKVSSMINSEPEFDSQDRPIRDKHFRRIMYNETEIPLAAPKFNHAGMGYHSPGDSQRMVDGFVQHVNIIKHGYDPANISPLYDPKKDITLGMINSNAGLEESSYYNQLGQKVYHNVRYGERYDPERHTLYIPEIEAFPNPFSVEVRKRNYLDDYVKYLKKHYPEIENPDILMRYYRTALAVKRIQREVLPNCPKNEIFRKDRKEIPVRCWLPNGECMVFDSIKQASEATGVSMEMIKKCCSGAKEEAYGLRWEYVDIADMDLMINKYLHDVIKVCDECNMDVDWNEYIDSGMIKRMEETIRFREKAAYNKFDNIRDVLYPERKEPGYFRSEWMKKRAEKWELLKAVKAEDVSEDEKYNPGKNEEMYGEFDPEGLPENPEYSNKGMSSIDEDCVPYSEGFWERMDETMYSRELDERAEKLEKKEKSVEFLKEKLREQNRRLSEKSKSYDSEIFYRDQKVEKMEKKLERELEKKDRQMEKVADIASGKLMGFLDGFLSDKESDSAGGSESVNNTEKETEDEKLNRLLNEEHNIEH